MHVDADKLMGRAEIRLLLGVGQTRVRQITSRADFPQPVKKLIGGYVWDGAAVEAWVAEHRPAPDEVES